MDHSILKVAILIVSDTASQDPSTDKCVPELHSVFHDAGTHWSIVHTQIVPDDPKCIQLSVKQWTDGERFVNCLITSGGTGFSTKDYTPEAVGGLLEKQAPGLVHAMLKESLDITPFAMMARPVAGVRKKTVIVTVPGSPKGARENLGAIVKFLPHACRQAAGINSRAMHIGGVRQLEKDAGVTHGAAAPQADDHTHHKSHSHTANHHSHGMPHAHTKPDQLVSNDPAAGPSRRHRHSPYPMHSVEKALHLIKEHSLKPLETKMPVNIDVVGHVLAEDVRAQESVPAFRASIVDGYAVRFPASGQLQKGVYPVSIISHAQASAIPELMEGQLARITTGAPLPPGSSAVVMVEDTVLKSMTDDGKEEKEVEILTSAITDGENVREIGSDVRQGDIVLRKGDVISAIGGEFGLIASVGVQEVSVYRKPVVGILSTGDELVSHNSPTALRSGEVRDTNRPTLLTAVKSTGFQAVDLGIASDQQGDLEKILRESFTKVDVVITTGGVSMGELDLLKPTVERRLGGEIHFGRVSMKPGKPTTFATVYTKDSAGDRTAKLIFGLPGNPASAVVTYHLFVLPSLHYASGVSPVGLPKAKVILDQDVQMDPQRNEYHRVAVVARDDGRLHAVSTGGQRSSRIGSFKEANGLLCLPAEKGVLRKGATVDALIMGKLMSEVGW